MSTTPSFQKLGVQPWLCTALQAMSIAKPTPIQVACIPPALEGRDVIGASHTGSGKTMVFALPILQSLANDPFGVYALVLTPTRELAFQISEQFEVLGKQMNLRQCVVIGGMDMITQTTALSKRPHVVIATPGRLADILRSDETMANNFRKMKYLVLDEADRLLDTTFTTDLDLITSMIPKSRQTILISATMTTNIEKITTMSMKDPFSFLSESKYETVTKLDQKYVFIPSKVKSTYLVYLLRNNLLDKTIIIFCGTCRTAERLRLMLRELNIRCTALHSQMSQADRLSSLAKFKGAVVNILLATDVASRGLDIPTVEVVLNYDIPASSKDYVHRVGRTARAGRGGLAVSVVCERDIELIQAIETKIEKTLDELELVEGDVLKLLNEVSEAEQTANMSLIDSNFGAKKQHNREKQGLAPQRPTKRNKSK